jgi:putative AlgH/UPF0301 family transcriptional regulator
MLLLSYSCTSTNAFVAPSATRVAFASTTASASALQYKPRGDSNNDNNKAEKALDEDWRQFRAKLVLQENGIERATDDQHQQWAYQQELIETGTLLVHTGDATGTHDSTNLLEHPYLYKSVMLVVETNDQDTVALMLNRPANVTITESDFTAYLLYGGPHASFHTNEFQRVYCLHRQPNCLDVSQEILSGLYLTSLEDAKVLHADGRAVPADFLYISGYEKLNTEDMKKGVASGNWKSITTDSMTLQNGLQPDLHASLLAWTGTPPTSEDTAGSAGMEDLMLKEWMRTCLHREEDDVVAPPMQEDTLNMADAMAQQHPHQGPPQHFEQEQDVIQAGDLLRASSSDHAFLFDHQEFHKSLVLILEANEDTAVGALLTYPTVEEDGLMDRPVRYGGDAAPEDVYCLHYMGPEAVPGSHQVGNSQFFQCSLHDAGRAMERGLSRKNDFLVIRGKVVFPKQGAALECVEPSHTMPIWDALSQQAPLSPFCLEENVDIARFAWQLAGGTMEESQPDLNGLGLAAVQKWVSSHLLQPNFDNGFGNGPDIMGGGGAFGGNDNYYRP